MNASSCTWKPFTRVLNASAIAEGLKKIPAHWSLAPLQDKSPKRTNWQIEDFIPHAEIARLILEGDRRTSKKGNEYTNYFSGFGIRTGEPSGGIIAIDVDGASAQPLLEAISGGDIPETVKWTSGKPGRFQVAFQIPDELRDSLKNFNRAVVAEWNGLQTARDSEGKPTELLEFRYNGVQSALPPSRHPTTGNYKWINSPDVTEVAQAPQWLCDLLLKLASDEHKKEEERKQRAVRWAEIQKQAKYQGGTVTNLVDFLEFEVLPKLTPEQIFNWQGHNFRDYGKTLKGCPPWRASASGTSFHVWWSGDHWAWQDKATGEGGGAVQYRWQLRGGRGTPKGKDFADIVAELAQDAGVAMPEFMPESARQQWDESAKFYTARAEEFERWEENCDRHIELQQQESFKSFFSNRLEKLKKFLSRTRPFKGFGQPAVAQNKPESGIVEFTASERIATIQALAQQAAAENRQLIVLDASEGGTGKSHLAGELTPQALGVNTIFYTSPNHRNPTVASIEQNYTDLHVRHDGLVSDDTQLTPLGNPYVRWAKPGEEPNVEGNCSKAHLFQTFGAKGYKEEVSAEASINSICGVCKWKSNCAGAEGLPTIPRHTFRQDRRNALANDRIRCNLDSLPDIAKMQGNPEDENQEPNRVAVVVDEFTQFRGFSETQANLSDFDNAWMYFKSQVHKAECKIKQLADQQEVLQAQVNTKLAESEKLEAELESITTQQQLDLGLSANNNTPAVVEQMESEITRLDTEAGELIEEVVRISEEINVVKKNTEELPSALAALEPIVFGIRSILNGEHDITSETRYGWNEAAVRGLLGDLTGLEQHLAVIRAFNPKLAALLKESDSVTLDGMSADDRKGSAPILKATRKLMQREVDKENREALANLPSNCIIPLLEILLGEKQGSFRIAYKDLTIFTRDERHRNQLKQADFTLILDGTLTRESLAQALDIDSSEIVVIRQKRSGHANLKIVQITGMGLLGRDRAESMKARVKAITSAIQEQHGAENVGVIDHAACVGDTAKESENGYWFRDNRGSNAFQNKTALLTFGTPFSNIGTLQMEYTTLTGDRNQNEDNPPFATFVQDRVQSEVAQGGWRLRSSRREGEQLAWYVVSDQDLSYLREYFPDAEFELKTAFEITPSAGSLGEQSYWAVLQASKQVVESGKELTTRAIAQIVGCNRSRISQIAKEVAGGFAAFERVLMFLLRSLYRTTNTPPSPGEPLTEDELFAAKTYLPLTLEENVSTPEDGVQEVLSTAQSLGEDSFQRVLRSLRWEDRALLLAQMVAVLPIKLQKEFLKVGKLLEEQVADQAIATP